MPPKAMLYLYFIEPDNVNVWLKSTEKNSALNFNRICIWQFLEQKVKMKKTKSDKPPING